jgi:hypothetical protein
MIDLVGRICRCDGTEQEMDAAVQLFLANCKHPAGTDLVFWPHGFPHDGTKPEPTVEEIVDKAMNYRPPWTFVANLWSCLNPVRSLQFVARSANTSGWNGSGKGRVAVEAPANNVLTFTETGSWQPLNGREIGFRNVFRWTVLGPKRVRLEHLRFGPGQPVNLFDLVPTSDQTWSSISPQLCREDCYTAELRLSENGLNLHWTIAGPKKQESIEYTYRWEVPS